MDKPRHPNVIRTWTVRRPARVVPPIKNEIDRQNRKRRDPHVQTPVQRSQIEKPSHSP
jgi:hypothetical protein